MCGLDVCVWNTYIAVTVTVVRARPCVFAREGHGGHDECVWAGRGYVEHGTARDVIYFSGRDAGFGVVLKQ